MIDCHCHMIPGVDDGARNLEQALTMARMAVSEGFTHVIATPHHANGNYWNEAPSVRMLVQQFNASLAEAAIPLKVLPGQEVRLHLDLMEAWQQGEVMTLNDSEFMLIELPGDQIPAYTNTLIHELIVAGVTPIVAHPERNKAIVNDMDRLKEWISLGALTQVTSHSLTGLFGRKIQRMSIQLIRKGLIHLIATDAHDLRMRTCQIRQSYRTLEKKVDKSMIDQLYRNAEVLLESIYGQKAE